MDKKSSLACSKRLGYVLAYVGPFIVVNILALIYAKNWSHVQVFAYIFLACHYAKRIAESWWVHRFGDATVPLLFVFFIMAYYSVLGGALVGYSVLKDSYKAPEYDAKLFHFLAVVFVFAEIMNYKCHAVLRDLRPPGTSVRGIPKGYGFDLVSSANYFWEIMSWLIFAIMYQTIPCYVFLVMGAMSMVSEAKKSHKSYLEYFNGKEGRALYPANRKAILPYLL